MDTERYFSWSQLSTYSECGEKYRLSYVERVDRESKGAFIGGHAIHAAIEWAEREGLPERWAKADGLTGERKRIEDAIEWVFHDEFAAERAKLEGEPVWGGRKSKEFPRGEDELWWARSGPMMLRRFLSIRYDDFERGWRAVDTEIEHRLTVTLPSGTKLKAILDFVILADQDGQAVIRDYKSGTWRQSAMQLATYAWAADQGLGVRPVAGEFAYLRTVDAAKRLDRYDLTGLVPLVPEMFAELERGIDAGLFMLNPSNLCSSCTVKKHCRYGAQIVGTG